jgi:hypothetical protein
MKTKQIYRQLLDASKSRKKEARKLRKQGLTWTAIGVHLGVTRQRAQQIGKEK